MSGLVSIIVPVYNMEMYIDTCMTSLLKQDYKEVEIILVDDGSTDKSSVMCDAYSKEQENIRVVHKENGGLSSARNRGLDEARGKYIIIVDPDDWVDNDCISKVVKVYQETDADFVGFQLYRDDGKVYENTDGSYYIYDDKEQAIKDIYNARRIDPFMGSYMLRKDIVDEYELRFDETLFRAQDTLFKLQYMLKCNTIVRLNCPLYHYCFNPNSIARGKLTAKSVGKKRGVWISYQKMRNILYETDEVQVDKDFADKIMWERGCWAHLFEVITAKYDDKEYYNSVRNDIKSGLVSICKNKQIMKKIKAYSILFVIFPMGFVILFRFAKSIK